MAQRTEVTTADILLQDLVSRLREGRAHAIAGHVLARELGISERTLRHLVDELIDRGVLVGSLCSGEIRGYFLIASEEDLAIGTRHLVSRAKALFRRVRTLRRAAEAHFAGSQVLRLFDLEEVET
ncbi:MAG TPA: HTH domain-containing protein [Actinomycetota bacterium]|nr:HTH domain-containing protein [Actinomycetota bacterium]